MNTGYEVPVSPTFRKHYDAGLAEGQRNAVLLVLKAGNLQVTDEQRQTIETCGDPETLKLWAERGTTATSTDDIFK